MPSSAWITPRQPALPPEVTAYRRQVDLLQAAKVRVHVSADERYLFYVDGQCVGRGSERGNISLPAGLSGMFRYSGQTRTLNPGIQSIDLRPTEARASCGTSLMVSDVIDDA